MNTAESRRILLNIEFDGANFCGWQLQGVAHEALKPSVQGWVEKSIQMVLRSSSRVIVQGCGRTDAGVSAQNFFAHFDVPLSVDFEFDANSLEKLRHSLNGVLPDDIGIKSCACVDPTFHALKSVVSKTYQYTLCVRRTKPVLARRFTYWIPESFDNINLKGLEDALASFVGEHDFLAFTPTETEVQTTRRKILDAWIKKDAEHLKICFKGEGFLRYQVRNMVGALIEVARNKRSPLSVKELLDSVSARHLAGFCAPPEGLILKEVHYS